MIKKKEIGELIARFTQGNFSLKFTDHKKYLQTIIEDMLVLDKDQRLSATELLDKHFKEEQFPQKSKFEKGKNLLVKYLKMRELSKSTSVYMLILMLLFIDFTKTDKSLANNPEPKKKEVCLRVKIHIFYFLKFISA